MDSNEKYELLLTQLRAKEGFICDMDGVIYHGNNLLPGVREFVNWLYEEKKSFLFLTNASERSPKELRKSFYVWDWRLTKVISIPVLSPLPNLSIRQAPGCSAYVIGGPGLVNALYDAGITMNDVNPDYVVVGETNSYNYNMILKAVSLINQGARLIATNSDLTGPSDFGIIPACRALVAPIELATGKKAYFVGKPNPLMMRTGLRLLDVHSEDAAMIGDRMDTDIVAGMESGLMTALVLSGVSTLENIKEFSYRPSIILNGVGDIPSK